MIYTGIDQLKRYSVACSVDAQGNRLSQARIEANTPERYSPYVAGLREPSEVVIEACWNWGVLYDILEDTPGTVERHRQDP